MTDSQLDPEPPVRRLRQYFVLALLSCLVVACTAWASLAARDARDDAEANQASARRLCLRLTALGQSCTATGAAGNGLGSDALAPAGPAPRVVAVTATDGHLWVIFADGTRSDAGPVDLSHFAIVLTSASNPAPMPTPPSGSHPEGRTSTP